MKRVNGMKQKSIRNYIFFSAVFLFFLMLFIVGLQRGNYIGFASDVTLTYYEDWVQVLQDNTTKKLNLPGKVRYEKSSQEGVKGQIVIQHELPQHIKSDLAVCLWVDNQRIQVHVDGEEIYSYGVDSPYIFGKNCGRYWSMIQIPESASGKELTITLMTPYDREQCTLDSIYIGTENSILFQLLKDYGVGLVLAFLFLVVGLATALLYLVFRKNIGAQSMGRTLYLCFFSVLMGIWMLVQSRLFQLFIGNSFVAILIYYMGAMLLPVPMLLFVAQIKSNHMRKLVMIFAYLQVAMFLLGTIWQFAGLQDFAQMVIFIQAGVTLSVVLLFVNAIVERFWYHNKEFRYTAFGIYLLAFFGVFEYLKLWLPIPAETGNFIRFGVVGLVFMLVYEAIATVVKAVEASKTAVYYERLATVDLLANCYSRTAYNRDMESLTKEQLKGLAVVLFDLNFLKRINDNQGHAAGDQAIQLCSLCIRKVFERVGKVYRIGGDEFVAVIPRCNEAKLQQRIEVFRRLCAEQNKYLQFHFRVACGYSMYDPERDRKVEDVIHRADAAMYECKMRMKKESGELSER